MTKETAKQHLSLFQAFAEGKTIQFNDSGNWTEVDYVNFEYIEPDDYRIKPEPRKWAMVANKLTGTIYSAGGWYGTLPDADADWEHVMVMEVLK